SGTLEKSRWVRAARSLGPLLVSAAAEQGTSDDRSGAAPHPFTIMSAQASLRITSHATFSGLVQRETGQRQYMLTPQDIVTAGASAQFQIGRLSLFLSG